VGTALIAVSTSLREVVVAIAALRLDAVDMAIGNLLGSNLFNIFILAVDDVFFTDGPLAAAVSSGHITFALAAVAMTSVTIVGFTYRAEKKRLLMAWDSITIVLIYLASMVLLYLNR